jgi:hypothetical protein
MPVDLEEIVDSITQDSPCHALRVLRLLRAWMKEIARKLQHSPMGSKTGSQRMKLPSGNIQMRPALSISTMALMNTVLP